MNNQKFDLHDKAPYLLYFPFIVLLNIVIYWVTIAGFYVLLAYLHGLLCTPLPRTGAFCYGFGGYDMTITFEHVLWYGGWLFVAIFISWFYQKFLWSKFLKDDSRRISLKLAFILTTSVPLIGLDALAFLLRNLVL